VSGDQEDHRRQDRQRVELVATSGAPNEIGGHEFSSASIKRMKSAVVM
jgi:hypothetical protein